MKKPTPFGKYYLLERINVGGMAEVFRAKAFGVEGFERLVAVKRILPNIAEDKEFIRMFIEEAKLSVQLNHANIAQIFDLGVVDGAYYIALEHVHGRDLRGIFDRCRQLGEAMPVSQACFMVMKVCEGLDYAHNKRDQAGRELSLVHRDVSPQNVLISFEGEVKIIDFGIAKAAGKGSKTQAGILKGKFGYMSPEQVRGLPVDRRSDVFSCGIVLYELLTGERLFVGESDFSTLEKVRNVEILPPSTYNRKIPDELERIVLKALAKDVEDRYQNAIDLHDELQAFVYTAGEFYSRKDLAGWMKKTFGREIEEETAKLETYRQLKPPPTEAPPAVARTSTGSKPPMHTPPPRRSTQAMNAVGGTKPPPPPTRVSQQLPVVPPGASQPPAQMSSRKDDSGGLAWDDDELETQIYDNPEDDPKNQKPAMVGGRPSKMLPLQPGLMTPHPSQPLAAAPSDELPERTATLPGGSAVPSLASAASVSSGPDLSSLVSSTSKGWESGASGSSPAATINGIGLNGASQRKLATGSNQTVAPEASSRASAMEAPAFNFDSPRIDTGARDLFDPMASFGSRVTKQRSGKKGILLLAIGGAVAAAIAVVVVIAMSDKGGEQAASTTPPIEDKQPAAAPIAAGDQNTGFDLYVSPSGVTQWKLDGETRTDRLPSRIRGITPGPHTVTIEAPAGFMSETQTVNVEMSKSGRVDITLQAIQGITGVFESTPPGANVSLIIDGKREVLGPAPVKSALDPRKTYQVLFEKAGYVSVNRPISFTGALEEKTVVNLEKAGSVAEVKQPAVVKQPEIAKLPEVKQPKDPKVKQPEVKQPEVKQPEVKGDGPKIDDTQVGVKDPTLPKEPKTAPKAGGQGTLTLGSKPPCEIYVDGTATGLHTPQKDMKLSAGKHRITLINNEFGIKESFAIEVKADEPTKMIKDYSDRLPK
ncbi:MAG: protein kinase [Myxococcota bacterium]|nr:protein kinase [Myxococcota bacterium]